MVYHSMDEVPVILTVSDLADILNISRNTAYDIIRSEQIKSKRVGNQIRIQKTDLENYLTVA